MIQRIFYVSVNVTDMDRSIAFYQKFGFRVEGTVDLNSAGSDAPFGPAAAACVRLSRTSARDRT